MEYKTDIPQLVAPWERRPRNQRLSAGLPAEMKDMLRSMARSVKDQHPFAVYMAGFRLGDNITTGPGPEGEKLFMAACIVGAFIEYTDIDQDEVSDPFIAALYRFSSKANHAEAAEKYIKEAGGWSVIGDAIKTYTDENPEIVEEIDASNWTGRGFNIDPETPESPAQSVDRFCRLAREALDDTGAVPIIFAMLDFEGKGIALVETNPGTSKTMIQNFIKMAQSALSQKVPDACRTIRVTEIWISENTEVQPSKSDTRREAICVALWDEDEGIEGQIKLLNIDRDADGKPFVSSEEEPVQMARPMAYDAPTLTAAEASEIAAECVAAIDAQINTFMTNPNPSDADVTEAFKAIEPRQSATLRVVEWMKTANKEMKGFKKEDGTPVVLLMATTIHSVADVLRNQGFKDEVRQMMEALDRSDQMAGPQ